MHTFKILKRILSFVLTVALLMMPAVSTAYAAESDIIEGEFVLDEIIIKFYDKSEFPGKEKQYDDEVAKVLKDGLSEVMENVYVVKSEDFIKNPNATLNRFKNSDFIEYVEPNYIAKADYAPNDPDFRVYTQRGFATKNLEGMWDISTDNPSVVAVLDSGVYAAHADLNGRVLTGYDFVNNRTGADDDNGHGTCVAGVIAAQGNNGIGAAGINWGASILPVKVLGSGGTGTVANIAKGIIWAADNGAKIINLSLGCTSDSITLKSAVDYSVAKGCILVAAVGNTGTNGVSYPARYDNVIGVGAETGAGARDTITCYGTGLDILAIGSYRTTTKAGGYGTAAGTSFSAPQVAGVLSLALAYIPNLDAYSARNLISEAAVGSGWTTELGYGTLDFQRFIEIARVIGGASSEQKDTVPPVLTLKGDATIELFEGDTYVEPGYTATDDKDGDITHMVTVSGTVSTAYEGEYKLTYTLLDKAGNMTTATRLIIVKPTPALEVKPPIITQIGSNPIILHLNGSPYIEQGAIAYDEVDGDISGMVSITGNVDTTREGTYQLTYSVTNSAGLSASVTRDIRVLAPKETITRTPYSFSGQGKKGANFKYTVNADANGIMSLTVSDLNKTTILVTVTDSTGSTVFSQTFSGNASQDFWVSEGTCSVDVSIIEGNGNVKFTLSLLTPEVIYAEFAEDEVPLGKFNPKTGDVGLQSGMFILLGMSIIGLGMMLLLVKKKRSV